MELKQRIINFIAETLDVKKDEIAEGKSLYDSIGVDSTEIVELSIALSKAFTVNIKQNEITKNSTPLQITELIENKNKK